MAAAASRADHFLRLMRQARSHGYPTPKKNLLVVVKSAKLSILFADMILLNFLQGTVFCHWYQFLVAKKLLLELSHLGSRFKVLAGMINNCNLVMN